MKKLAVCLVLLVVIGLPSAELRAQRVHSARQLDGSRIANTEIDATVTRLMNDADVTGLALVIFDHGVPVYMRAYGVRDKEKNLPLTVDSVMSAASFSKIAFAYLVMKLVDDGTINLDKPVYQYLPKPLTEYPQYADLAGDERYELITPRMLLDHTSGFANWRWLEDDHKLKIHFQPGSRYAYSGEGIDLLRLVVETVTRRPLEELMQQRVFEPLGMIRTSMVWQPVFERDYANGYDEYGRSLGPQRRKKADAAGSMQTTISDFSKFLRAVMSGQGLKKKTWEQMLAPQIQINSQHEFPTLVPATTDAYMKIRLSYGLGWGLYWTPYGKAIFKEGHDEGWRNYTLWYERQGSGLVVMTNSSNGEGIYKELIERLAGDTWNPADWEGFTPYNKLPPRPPLKQHKAIQLPTSVLDLYVGRYGEPGLILKVTREGDHLVVQENDEPRQALLPQSGSDFFSTTSDYVCTFQFDSQSHRMQLILHADGKDILIKPLAHE